MNLSTLKFQQGILADETPLSAEGFFIDADKIRFVRGKAETIGGWEKASNDQFQGKCRGLHSWQSLDGQRRAAIGTHEKLYGWVDGKLTDITPASDFVVGMEHGSGGQGYGTGTYSAGEYSTSSSEDHFPLTWCLSNWGEHLMAVPRRQGLFHWTLQGSAERVVSAPHKIESMFVTPERIVVACGSSEIGSETNFDPMMVRWSDQEDHTNWMPTVTNQAGDIRLETGSRIVRGLSSRGEHLIWTDEGLHKMVYTGDSQLVYSFALAGKGCGLIGPNAAVVAEGKAFWISPGGEFYVYAGGSPQPIPCSVRRHFFDNLTRVQHDKIYAGVNTAFNEVWWFYPDTNDGNECSRYIIYNYEEGHWCVGRFDRTAWIDQGVLHHPLAAGSDGYLYYHDRLFYGDGSVRSAFLKSGDFDLGDGNTLLQVNSIIPDIEDLQGGMTVQLTAKRYPNTVPEFSEKIPITSQTEKQDLRITGRQMSVTFESNDAPSFWRLGAVRLDIKDTGETR